MRRGRVVPLLVALLVAAGGVCALPASAAADPYGPDPWLVREAVPGAGLSTVEGGVALGGRVVYSQRTPSTGFELWVSDGTPAGTVVMDLNPGATGSAPRYFARAGNQVFFYAWLPGRGGELWATDGTPAGTRLVKDIEPGPASSNPTGLVAAGNQVFFVAETNTAGEEVWVSDGTAAGTVQVDDIYPGVTGSAPGELRAVGSRVAFHATDNTSGSEPWISDGTPAGTVRMGNINPAGGSGTHGFTLLGDAVLFSAEATPGNAELYRWPGTGPVSTLVKDIWPGPNGSSPNWLTALGGQVYFAAGVLPGLSVELWVSDGTSAGTHLVHDINPGVAASGPRHLTIVGGILHLVAEGPEGWGLRAVTGPTTPTRLIRTLPAGTVFASTHDVQSVGGGLAFSVQIGLTDTLWLSDGTAGGTRPLLGLVGPDVAVRTLGNVSGTVFFAAKHPTLGDELWAHTWRTSSVTVTARKKWSAKRARKKKIRVQVHATASEGSVTLWAKGRGKHLSKKQKRLRQVGTGVLVNGMVTIRLTKKLKRGSYQVYAQYAASLHAQASTSSMRTIKVKVKR
ncbi:hypothetical protein RB608_09555 [Nocardioides sp. LHD-245]|uniref:hypothetical protein n=1 Tax=Nocardioides sp. LHD-245 TaxID=3051387 RepID=UPI0027E0D4DA|nr:hypothetical protein [Nocardioides sp. LHD-245]